MYHVTMFAEVKFGSISVAWRNEELYCRTVNFLDLIVLKDDLLYMQDCVSDDYFRTAVLLSEFCK